MLSVFIVVVYRSGLVLKGLGHIHVEGDGWDSDTGSLVRELRRYSWSGPNHLSLGEYQCMEFVPIEPKCPSLPGQNLPFNITTCPPFYVHPCQKLYTPWPPPKLPQPSLPKQKDNIPAFPTSRLKTKTNKFLNDTSPTSAQNATAGALKYNSRKGRRGKVVKVGK